MPSNKRLTVKELQAIPGVGPSIAEDLWNIGIRSLGDLRSANPEALWNKISAYQGEQVCRCVLYTMRCAVYFASNESHEPELLKWWNWKRLD